MHSALTLYSTESVCAFLVLNASILSLVMIDYFTFLHRSDMSSRSQLTRGSAEEVNADKKNIKIIISYTFSFLSSVYEYIVFIPSLKLSLLGATAPVSLCFANFILTLVVSKYYTLPCVYWRAFTIQWLWSSPWTMMCVFTLRISLLGVQLDSHGLPSSLRSSPQC